MSILLCNGQSMTYRTVFPKIKKKGEKLKKKKAHFRLYLCRLHLKVD